MSSQVYQNVVKAAIALSRSHSSSHRLISSSTGTLARVQGLPVLKNNLMIQPCAYISKNADKKNTIAADITPSAKTEDVVATSSANTKKNWVSYGFDWESEEDDINNRNGVMFFCITVSFVLTGFFLTYFPDFKLKNWTQREAYIELTRREALGLPLIDRDLIPVEKFNLPSEEELEDFEIII